MSAKHTPGLRTVRLKREGGGIYSAVVDGLPTLYIAAPIYGGRRYKQLIGYRLALPIGGIAYVRTLAEFRAALAKAGAK